MGARALTNTFTPDSSHTDKWSEVYIYMYFIYVMFHVEKHPDQAVCM